MVQRDREGLEGTIQLYQEKSMPHDSNRTREREGGEGREREREREREGGGGGREGLSHKGRELPQPHCITSYDPNVSLM